MRGPTSGPEGKRDINIDKADLLKKIRRSRRIFLSFSEVYGKIRLDENFTRDDGKDIERDEKTLDAADKTGGFPWHSRALWDFTGDGAVYGKPGDLRRRRD